MIIYVNSNNEIKSVDKEVDGLIGYELEETMNPFNNWSNAKICCYKVHCTEVMEEVVIGTKEEDYIDLDGNEQSRTVDVIEKVATGLYYVDMMTPYVDSRILDTVDMLGRTEEENEENITMVDDKVEDYSAELLFQICLLELGLDEEDLEEDE